MIAIKIVCDKPSIESECNGVKGTQSTGQKNNRQIFVQYQESDICHSMLVGSGQIVGVVVMDVSSVRYPKCGEVPIIEG
jgi:hypothetical protein